MQQQSSRAYLPLYLCAKLLGNLINISVAKFSWWHFCAHKAVAASAPCAAAMVTFPLLQALHIFLFFVFFFSPEFSGNSTKDVNLICLNLQHSICIRNCFHLTFLTSARDKINWAKNKTSQRTFMMPRSLSSRRTPTGSTRRPTEQHAIRCRKVMNYHHHGPAISKTNVFCGA